MLLIVDHYKLTQMSNLIILHSDKTAAIFDNKYFNKVFHLTTSLFQAHRACLFYLVTVTVSVISVNVCMGMRAWVYINYSEQNYDMIFDKHITANLQQQQRFLQTPNNLCLPLCLICNWCSFNKL